MIDVNRNELAEGSISVDDACSPLLECRGISKRFGGEVALWNVDFDLRPGEVHGLVGSNGAGKSTLMKILAGALPDHSGEIYLQSQPVTLSSPSVAMAHGIAMVYQELSGIGQLSVAENLFLGRQTTTSLGRIHWKQMRQRAKDYLAELEIAIDVDRRLDSYPLVIRQMIEIARGLHSGARVLILDEPTSALSPPETKRLFQLIKQLRDRGISVIFISHFIEDVLEICDRVTILKDGRKIETTPTNQLDKHYVIHTMLGHSLKEEEKVLEAGTVLPQPSQAEIKLTVTGLSRSRCFENIDLQVRRGECLGIYGYVGAGHQELVRCIAGALRSDSGTVTVNNKTLKPGNVHQAVQEGVVLVPADRADSLVHQAPIYKNATLAHLRRTMGNWIFRFIEVARVGPLLDQVGCRPPLPRMKTGQLSGGNQQKVVLAKWFLGPIEVLLLEEPTRGMDVGAKQEVLKLVQKQQRLGAAVILASCEPELILAHADRVLVMSRGRIVHEFAGSAVDKTSLMRFA